MSRETPTISSTAYTSNTVDTASFISPTLIGAASANPDAVWMSTQSSDDVFSQNARRVFSAALKSSAAATTTPEPQTTMSTIRIVKVFIADPNENLPLDKRLMYSGDEQLTDLTDQELFFEVPIAELLKAHNEMRKKTVDKKQTEKFGRDVFLEPVRIRDLRMVVVAVAAF